MVQKPPAESMGVTVGVDASSPNMKSSRGNVLSSKLACLCCLVFLGLAIVVILVLLYAVGNKIKNTANRRQWTIVHWHNQTMLPCFSLLPSPNKQQHKGYGHFTPPCVGIESIEVGAIDIDFLSVLSGSPKGNHRQDFRYCVYWRRPLT